MDKDQRDRFDHTLGMVTILTHVFIQLHPKEQVAKCLQNAKEEMLHGSTAKEYERYLHDAFETLEIANNNTKR